jgi:hypothetical protein
VLEVNFFGLRLRWLLAGEAALRLTICVGLLSSAAMAASGLTGCAGRLLLLGWLLSVDRLRRTADTM